MFNLLGNSVAEQTQKLPSQESNLVFSSLEVGVMLCLSKIKVRGINNCDKHAICNTFCNQVRGCLNQNLICWETDTFL